MAYQPAKARNIPHPIETLKYSPEMMFTADETSLSVVQTNTRGVVTSRHIGALTSAERW